MRSIIKILVPTDFSLAADEAFQMAQTLAQATGASVTVFHVALPPAFMTTDGKVVCDDASSDDAKNLWDDLRKIRPEDSRVRVEHQIIVAKKSDAAHILEIIESLEGDLIVTGTTGRTGLKHLQGANRREKVPGAEWRLHPAPSSVARAGVWAERARKFTASASA